MISFPQGLILGLVQGLTEFLPVSSSGHLILTRELLKIDPAGGLAFDAVLQLGTILAVGIYFFKDFISILKNKKYLIAIMVGTLPALALGILLEKTMETLFRNSLLVALALVAGSGLFFAAERVAKQKTENVNIKQAWWIGCFQALALIPGVSRSGATISGALFLGIKRENAARFSFILSMPIIAGSGLKKLLDIASAGTGDFNYAALVAGFLTSFVVGIFCIHWLLQFLKKHSLLPFAVYRLLLAAVIILIRF
ncbi:MAG: undecaprenyl-diphosphatase UppP [Patescibacteria group bacterium]